MESYQEGPTSQTNHWRRPRFPRGPVGWRISSTRKHLRSSFDRRIKPYSHWNSKQVELRRNCWECTATGTLNIVVGDVGRVSNIWPRVRSGDSLYLVLKRTTPDGPFQFVPYGTRPTLVDLEYTSLNGTKTFGHVLYIGQVVDNNGVDMRTISETLWKGKSSDAYAAALECRNTDFSPPHK